VGSVAGKLLLYVGLALSFAAAVVGLLAFGGRVPERKRVLRFAAASAVVGVVTMLRSAPRSACRWATCCRRRRARTTCGSSAG
jgi:putative copper export protein